MLSAPEPTTPASLPECGDAGLAASDGSCADASLGVDASLGAGVDAARDESGSICVGCGLCCDGTLFSHLGVLDESDLGMPLRALGVELVVEAEPPVFALPCPAVERGVCTIYHLQRPKACGWFECDLSTGVAEGRVAAADARVVITETLALQRRVHAGAAERSELHARVVEHFRRG